MAEIFEHVDDLPVTPQDGTACGIRIPSAHVEHLIYHAAQDAWIGRAHWSMRVYQNEGLKAPGNADTWKYPGAFPESPSTRGRSTPHQFQIHLVHHAGELWDAGLRLQEHCAAMMQRFDPPEGPTGMETGRPALSWYPLADGDDFLSPVAFNHGVQVVAPVAGEALTYRHCSSGWQNTPTLDTEPAVDDHFYPEIYVGGPEVNLRQYTARHRWVAGDVGGAGSGEDTSGYPIEQIVGWYRAAHIPVADDDPVPEWGDMSGRMAVLQQSDSSKQPVVMSAGGIRFVRFDGTDDVMRVRLMPNRYAGDAGLIEFAQPVALFAVMRQRATGGTQQVWFGRRGSGAPLFYRGDATDQVNIWMGGSDATYNRSSAWPSPWMVWSVTAPGDGSVTVREGTTTVLSGSVGGTGMGGLVVGNNHGETLPAALDLAELIVCYKLPSTDERNAVIDMLETRYGL